jgi:hypothetical protein
LENPDDYVRIEIATALERNTRVIPLLVQGATMPRADELPEDLAPLARRNAFELHDFSWNEEVGRLITTLDRVIERSRVEEPRQQPEPRLVEFLSEGQGPLFWVLFIVLVIIVIVVLLLFY